MLPEVPDLLVRPVYRAYRALQGQLVLRVALVPLVLRVRQAHRVTSVLLDRQAQRVRLAPLGLLDRKV